MILKGELTALIKSINHYSVKARQGIDWKLLVFLVLLLNVKLVLKLAAVVFIILLYPYFKKNLKAGVGPVEVFYISMIILAILNALFYGSILDTAYIPVLLTGIFFWLICLAISDRLRAYARSNPQVVEQTIIAVIILNAVVSFVQLFIIMIDSGSINPFSYQGEYQKYFISTGDYIKGLSFDTSTTNAAINAMAVIYFLYLKRFALVFLSMSVLLITSSNFINLILLISLLVFFVYRSVAEQKSAITICVLMIVVFMSKVSPENSRYSAELYAKFFGSKKTVSPLTSNALVDNTGEQKLLSADEIKEQIAIDYLDSIYLSLHPTEKKKVPGMGMQIKERPMLPADDIHSAAFQHKDSVNAQRQKLLAFIADHEESLPYAGGRKVPTTGGKLQALKNDIAFFKENPEYIFTGTGAGNYSSKLAFRVSGLNMAGGFPSGLIYISPFFLSNHLDIYLYFFTQKAGRHSVANAPNSVYGQLMTEYGLIGLIMFVLFYLRYFFSGAVNRFPVFPLVVVFCGLLSMDYWFEQLSLIVFFELMMYGQMKSIAGHA